MSIEKDLGNKLLFSIYNKDEKNIEEYKTKYFNHLSLVVKNKTDMDLFDRIGDKLRDYYTEKMRETKK